ncbi:MAG: Gldg family protein [Lachnospiraceae bacterium]|nr:Gldg family protein [Lachnospiraceae bacterium]
MIAIFKREFKAYLNSVVGFLFMAVTLFFFGLYTAVYNMASGYPYISYTVSAILFLFLLSIPVLTMRILADERKQKTDQLILTAPVTVGQIVVGKYLAMAAVFMVPVAFMCVVPPFLTRFGSVPMLESYVAILAFALYGLACLAVGMFISSLTESQVIAAVLSFGALFLTYMMSGISSLISSTGNIVTEILSVFDFQTRFSNLTNGIMDVNAIVYFISVIVVLLFLTAQSIQKRRYSVSVKNVSMGAYSSVTIVIALAIVVIVNMAVAKLPSKYTNIDVTDDQLYSITEQTEEILANLTEDVTIYAIVAEDNADTTVAQTLKCYEDASEHITVTYVDPLVNPQFYSQYSSSMSQHSLVVESAKRYKVIDYYDLYQSEMDYTTYSTTVTGYDAEGQITSAISYCVSDDMPKVYMIAGHNEYSLDSGFTTALEKENIEYETISLMDYETVPEDAECLIIHAPESDFSEDDATKVIDYINQGGKVFMTTEYVPEDQPNFESIMEAFGISLIKGYAVDVQAGNYYQTPIYLLPNVEVSAYSSNLTGDYTYVFAPYAQGLEVAEDTDEITYTTLLTASEESYVKTNLEAATSFEKEEGDVEGPITLGVVAEKTTDAGTGTLFVFSCAQIFTDSASQAVSGTNQQLFSNIMGTVANHEISVSIPVKSYTMEYLTASTGDIILFEVVAIVAIPLALIIIGLVIWLKRRKK